MLSSSNKVPIYNLPISSSAPIYHLKPDPLFPDVPSVLHLSDYDPPDHIKAGGAPVLKEGDPIPPSMLRRSRILREGGVFTYTTPLPLEFPYELKGPAKKNVPPPAKVEGQDAEEEEETVVSIESKLAILEPDLNFPVLSPNEASTATTPLSSSARLETLPSPKLLAFSTNCAAALLPNLDYGDAGTVVLDGPSKNAEDVKTRELLVDVMGGKTVLAKLPCEGETGDLAIKNGFAPWSLCYGGHQFGSWAGQLGDGRALSILSTPATPEVKKATGGSTVEVQLKGAGRTPYSRFADGLAVLRSSIREFLGAEAMAALGQPTSRALAIVGISDVKVRRETLETAAIVTRVSSSWIRIGNFEIQTSRGETETISALTRYVGNEVFRFGESVPAITEEGGRSFAFHVLREVSRRTALMIAGWQAYGFMHGVMNTDNIAVNGACIDYGPYAFMDVFEPLHICNHSDDAGRYSFRNQPTMGLFAIQKLANSLVELIGCEDEIAASSTKIAGLAAVPAGEDWAAVRENLAKWKDAGSTKVKLVEAEFLEIFKEEYKRLMGLRFGYLTVQDGDFQLLSSFLDLLQSHALDYSLSIRLLSSFDGTTTPLFSTFLDRFLSPSATIPAREEVTNWFEKYQTRLKVDAEKSAEESSSTKRNERMNKVNPRFVLRQWILEETIARAEKGDLKSLDRVLKLAEKPFESYGEEVLGDAGSCRLDGEEDKERQRLCGVGDKDMLGFQCSCSS